jgi:hypothetical protein
MKKLYTLLLAIMICLPSSAQLMKNLDQVGIFNEGLAAIKKGDQWAFMDKKGEVVIDFRDDLVATTDENGILIAPEFHDGRALISSLEDGILFYGYIDTTGEEVILIQYVNATPFNNGFAIVMQYTKEVVGKNKVLGKDVVCYEVEEFVIDLNDKAMTPMLHTRNCVPDKMKSGKKPELTTQFLGERMVGVKMGDQKWEIYNF